MTELRQQFGRPLRLAMVGGGPDSWIGRMHLGAAEFDGLWQVVAAVCSGDPARSRTAGPALGIDPGRAYGTLTEMIAAERARPDGIEAVAIMTPNDTHYAYAVMALEAGLDVVADKPVSHDFAEACHLRALVREGGRLYAITHGYSAYPMVRYARRLALDGALGDLRLVQVEYIQSGFATRVEDGPLTSRLRWLLDPSRSGLAMVMSAIGCHAQHLASFATGRRVARVMADVGALVPGRRVVDYVSALVELEGGVRGTFTATQAAAGSENDIRLRVYGERGMIDWTHRVPSYLTVSMQGEASRVVGRGDPYLPPDILAGGRAPRGHPEGLREAFANIYGEVAQERMARQLGEQVPAFPYPRIDDGAHTMAFIEACLASQATGRWTEVAPLPA